MKTLEDIKHADWQRALLILALVGFAIPFAAAIVLSLR